MFATTPTAVLFPGQGSQTEGMRDFVARDRPDLLEIAVDAAGEDPFGRVAESTRFAQPAICAASLTGWSQLADSLRPHAVAGHSLGELAALAAAGVLSEESALRLSAVRGRLMADAGEAAGGGTMLALIGATSTQARRLAAAHDVVVANDNAPGQLVLSGGAEELAAARRTARAEGLRALPLDVAGAFHSPQMAGAEAAFREALADVEIGVPRGHAFSCATAAPFTDVREELAAALTQPVRWRETMAALDYSGSRHYVDAGPGRVLAKLVPRNVPGATAAGIEEALGAAA